jgi:hypothetical protein
VSTYERAIHWLAARLPGVDVGYRRDVAATTCDALRDAKRCRRWLELVSLAGLAVRLRSPLRIGGRPEAVWSHGLRLGALVSLTALACDAAARGTALDDVGVAVGLALAVTSALSGRRLAAVCLVLGTALFELVLAGLNTRAEALVTICLVGAGGLIAGPGGPTRHGRKLALGIVAVLLALFLAAIAVGPGAPRALTASLFVWACPLLLIALGWLDPRLAAAATVLVFARLAASGFGELGHALAVLHEGQRDLLVRWLLMGTGVVAAWAVTHRAIGRQRQL